MDAKMNLEELVIYDFSNLNYHENYKGNCFSCDSCDDIAEHSCDREW